MVFIQIMVKLLPLNINTVWCESTKTLSIESELNE